MMARTLVRRWPMTTIREKALIPVAAAVVAASCHDPLGDNEHITLLTVIAGGFEKESFEREWPPSSGEYVTVNQSLTDSAGLAGIVVEVMVPGKPSRTLMARDFLAQGSRHVEGIVVPEAGTASIFVKLYQSGELVAEGHVSWRLDSGVQEWVLAVTRVPVAWGVEGYSEITSEWRCYFPWCHQIERLEIEEAARNYPDEALWLVLDKHLIGGWEG